MRESTMYQSILREGEEIGLERGLTQGRIVGETELVLKRLTRKVGSLSPELIARVSALSLEQLDVLGEALLYFDSVEELTSWLG
ncbi:DUF4351 domain-containing protein [Aliterella atlantica]|uniref:DUF4351 domain-containing protein n=1 Tax=Aliterella atlantica TaxID=1827278 RepID=UPI000696D243|nr:DUF4351 domain-containing protein [Aliterella atlantica]